MRVYERLQGRMVELTGVDPTSPEARGIRAPLTLALLAALAVLALAFAGGVFK